MVNELMFAVFNAAAFGMAIFLVAAGLTLIFGLLRLLNMAQGGFFMIGAYTAYSVMGRDVQSFGMFMLGILAGGVVVALLGLVVLFQLVTAPVASHMIGRAAVRGGRARTDLLEVDELSERQDDVEEPRGAP